MQYIVRLSEVLITSYRTSSIAGRFKVIPHDMYVASLVPLNTSQHLKAGKTVTECQLLQLWPGAHQDLRILHAPIRSTSSNLSWMI